EARRRHDGHRQPNIRPIPVRRPSHRRRHRHADAAHPQPRLPPDHHRTRGAIGMLKTNWLKDTTQAYRRGWVEGEEGHENVFLVHAGLTSPEDIADYERGFYDAMEANEDA